MEPTRNLNPWRTYKNRAYPSPKIYHAGGFHTPMDDMRIARASRKSILRTGGIGIVAHVMYGRWGQRGAGLAQHGERTVSYKRGCDAHIEAFSQHLQSGLHEMICTGELMSPNKHRFVHFQKYPDIVMVSVNTKTETISKIQKSILQKRRTQMCIWLRQALPSVK